MLCTDHFATSLLIVICGSFAIDVVVRRAESLVHIGLYINPRFFYMMWVYCFARIISANWCLMLLVVHFLKTLLIEVPDSLNLFEINSLIRIISYHWYFYLYLVLCSSMGWNCHCESFFVLRVSYHFQFFYCIGFCILLRIILCIRFWIQHYGSFDFNDFVLFLLNHLKPMGLMLFCGSFLYNGVNWE